MRTNRTIQGDCLEVMPLIQGGSVDMVLCDPPYGTINGLTLKGWDTNTTSWDNLLDPLNLLSQCEHVLRHGGSAIVFGKEPYTSKLVLGTPNNLPFSYTCIWVKDHFSNPLGCKKSPVNFFESIVVYFKKYDKQNRHDLRSYSERVRVFCGGLNNVNKKLGHRRAEHFLSYTNPGDLVLDPCCGSGTTGLACINTDRRYIQIEQDPKYVEITRTRCGEK